MKIRDLTTHELNKREMFDRMRAYHDSEISHKTDAINLLKSIFTGTIAAYAAIVGAIVTPNMPISDFEAFKIIWLAFIFVSAVALGISVSTNRKITKDHEVYDQSLKEYSRECEYLGLRDSYIWDTNNNEPMNIKPIPINVDAGKGYKFTQNIIAISSASIVIMAYLFTHIALLLTNKLLQSASFVGV